MTTASRVYGEKKYGGQYVTVKYYASKTVITHGKKPADVFNRAKKKGIEEPILLYIPKPGMVHLY
jgi:hypothetical protein